MGLFSKGPKTLVPGKILSQLGAFGQVAWAAKVSGRSVDDPRFGWNGFFSYHAISEEDKVRVLRDPNSMVASDGEVIRFGAAAPHPRGYGTFVRVLGRYVRELKIIALQDAVRKMTSFPAQRLGLFDRGLVRPGLKADLVLFDDREIGDRSTFEAPHQYAVGVKWVLVNGEVVFNGETMTAARPGKILKGPAADW